MTTLYVLVGLPGSGKSTWARENAGRLDAVVVCSDAVRRDFDASGRDAGNTDLVFVEVERRARALLRAGSSVVLDATHFNRAVRGYAVQVAGETQAHRVAIWFDLPLSVSLERNLRRGADDVNDDDGPFLPMSAQDLRRLAEQFQPPGADEFDEVVRMRS